MVLLYPTKSPRRKKCRYCTLQNHRGGKKDATVPYKIAAEEKIALLYPTKPSSEAKRMLLYPTKPPSEAKENGAFRGMERLRCMYVRLTS